MKHKLILILLLVVLISPIAYSATREEAYNSIQETEDIISELKAKNISVTYFEDKLLDSERVLNIINNLEIIQNSDSSIEQRNEAKKVINLVDLNTISYDVIINNTEALKLRRTQTYEIIDLMSLINNTIKENKELNLSKALELFNQASVSFSKEKYDETINLLKDTRKEIETQQLENTRLNALKNNIQGFLLKNWKLIVLVVIVLVILVCIVALLTYKLRIKKQIRKLENEREAITLLIKKAQKERFRDNKLSDLVYKIKLEKYKEREEEIKQELPVLKNKIRK